LNPFFLSDALTMNLQTQHMSRPYLQTQKMLEKPLNRAIVAHIREHGTCTGPELFASLRGVGLMCPHTLFNLVLSGVLVNVSPPHSQPARFALGQRAELFDGQPVPKTVVHSPAPTKEQANEQANEEGETDPTAPWEGQKAMPNQYDVMRAPVWRTPPDTSAMRPGALDHLKCKSFGHRC
jgi:hypothetical protein